MVVIGKEKVTIEERNDCVVIKLDIPNYTMERRIPWPVLKHIYEGRLYDRVKELINYARERGF